MNTKMVKSLSFSNKKADNKPSPKGLFGKLGSPFSTQSQPSTPAGTPPHLHSTLSDQAAPASLEEKQLYEEIAQCRVALDHFLNSNINEAEAILKPHYKDSMYFSLGYSFILYLKSVMTFQEDDIEATLGVLKHTIQLAANLRKKESGWLGSVTSWVKGTTLEDVKSMTVVERHAVRFHPERDNGQVKLITVLVGTGPCRGLSAQGTPQHHPRRERHVVFAREPQHPQQLHCVHDAGKVCQRSGKDLNDAGQRFYFRGCAGRGLLQLDSLHAAGLCSQGGGAHRLFL